MATPVDAKLLKQTKFPPEFNQKVDMKKLHIEVMKKWISERISEILGHEDDIVVELCFNLLEGSQYPDIKSLQIQLTGFLDKDTPAFCKELWALCLDGQANPQGIPKKLLEEKKEALKKEQKSESETRKWKNCDVESVQIVLRPAAIATSVDESRDLRPDTEIEAETDIVSPHLVVSTIVTRHPAMTEVADQPAPPILAPLLPDTLLGPLRRRLAAAAEATADLDRRIAEIARKEDGAARTTVIDTV
ncbi:hypothetical protein N7532_001967 [Penicillium argentinense]|uniref:PWI domain-containing protein n=1 Tax=Penicillium argentinense TaxID=1131581 RepID=A0A9W9G3L8_9EURO|nr:uncharacterized protein N7532_001967 [Penicillium argentinense]KAJ5111432.1 hypothetical protein N7532_001967 [Penicillium argentinense]